MARTKRKTVKIKHVVMATNKVRFVILSIFLFGQPLILNPFGWNIYLSSRITLLYFSASLMIILTIYDNLKTGKVVIREDMKWLAIAFAGLSLSTIFSIHKITALFGAYPRFEGFFTLVSYGVIFYCTYDLLRNRKEVVSLLNILAIASILASIYGILQFFGLDFISWGKQIMDIKRSFSSLGNPVSFGNYLALIGPINIYMAISNRKWIFITAAILNITALIMTFSFGAWVGFSVGLLVIVFLLTGRTNYTKLVAVSFFAVLAVVLVILLMTPNFTRRAESIVKGRGSFEARVLIWKNALPLLLERPFLGSGADTFTLAFQPKISPEYERKVSRNIPADRAHNELLHWAITLGLLTLLPILIFIALVMKSALRKAKDDEIIGAICSGLIAYFVCLQFFFSTISESPIFWALLGVIGYLSLDKAKLRQWTFKSPKQSTTVLLVVGIFVTVIPLLYGSCLLCADYYYRQAEIAVKHEAYTNSFLEYRKAVAFAPYVGLYKEHYAKNLVYYGLLKKYSIETKRGCELFRELIEFNPIYSPYYYYAGSALLSRYSLDKNRTYLLEAVSLLKAGLKKDPNNSEMRFKLAVVDQKIGRNIEAIANYEQFLVTRPHSPIVYKRLLELTSKNKDEDKIRYYRYVINHINKR